MPNTLFFYLVLIPSLIFFTTSIILIFNFYIKPKRFLKQWQVLILSVFCYFNFFSTMTTSISSISNDMYFGCEIIYINFLRTVLMSILLTIILDLYLVVFWNKNTFLKLNKK
jgi:hypothetical protein